MIAVPTSVGYGASLGGIAALLSMLNSCAAGVAVVNIDNGFGAGQMAAMLNRKRDRERRLRGLHLHFEPTSGIAGDMAVAALVDLGVPPSVVTAAVDGDGRARAARRASAGASAAPSWARASTSAGPAKRAPTRATTHDARTTHHDHGARPRPRRTTDATTHAHEHRDYAEVQAAARSARASTPTRARWPATSSRASPRSRRSCTARASTASRFHEVGAYDSIADVVGVAAAIAAPGARVDRLAAAGGRHRAASAPRTVRCRCRRRRPPRCWRGDSRSCPKGEGELTTPTGAAILAAVVDAFGPLPPMRLARRRLRRGHARAHRSAERAARRRSASRWGGRTRRPRREVVLLEANIDDMSPRAGRRRSSTRSPTAGAVDVWSAPILMKKGRPGGAGLGAGAARRARPRSSAPSSATRRRWACAGGALERVVLARSFATVATPYGQVRVKLAALDGEVLGAHPEFEDCRRLAARAGVPVREVVAAAAAGGAALLPRGARGGKRARERRRDRSRARRPGQGRAGAGRRHRREPAPRRRPSTSRVALGADSVSLLALLVRSGGRLPGRRQRRDRDGPRAATPLAQYPHIRRALEVGEVTMYRRAAGAATPARSRAVFPVIVGRKPAGALLARFAGDGAAATAEAAVGRSGRLAASLLGHRAARREGAGADPRAHPPDHAPRRPRGAAGARDRALPRLHRQRLRRHRRARRRRARSST